MTSPIPFSYASFANASALEALYQQYLKDPQSIENSWRYFFEGFDFARSKLASIPTSGDIRSYLLIEAYRRWGHLRATSNPIALHPPSPIPELTPAYWGFKDEEYPLSFPTYGFLKEKEVSLKEIIESLEATYCGKIGVEYMEIASSELERWLQQQIEPGFISQITQEKEWCILQQLGRAEIFEHFIHTKYVGQKRFSLEGSETLIPLLHHLIEEGASLGVSHCVLGMAHRGRLNVLANILHKSYAHIFHEFEDSYSPELSEGTSDVKYHKGFVGELMTSKGESIAVTLVANPSHLESVDPVVEGICRAKQDLSSQGKSSSTKAVLPILIHGDSALSGQGVVYETLQFGRLEGYATGGTIHIVINNQIGFTTLPKDSRSTTYCTDIAKAFKAPVFHVNAEDPLGCIRVAELAIQLRNQFGCDVFIDLNGYRKYGHNEGDEPSFTQPLEYALIRQKKSIRSLFEEQLVTTHKITQEEAAAYEAEFKTQLQEALSLAMTPPHCPLSTPSEDIALNSLSTAVDFSLLQTLTQKLCTIPEGMTLHPKIERLLQERTSLLSSDPKHPAIDWSFGETLAYATLLQKGISIRISGQDSKRGTFSHRHAVWIDQKNAAEYSPLAHINPEKAPFTVYNSPLSEFAVLGFDFGYSLAHPNALVLWEAQYGDFANGAQVIIDQYIAASEQKWGLHTSMTLLLPHGYEGQGPEHSSARIERFLQLAGRHNTRIANVSTPAQCFHLLRAQALNPVKKPLILFTPKALLRHPECLSALTEFTSGNFKEILEDPSPPSQPKKWIFCSGKVYYDLCSERKQRQDSSLLIFRIEQLYPFPRETLENLLKKHPSSEPHFWVQEEPENMGAWNYLRAEWPRTLRYIGREASASPAVGSQALYKAQYTQFMNQVFEVMS